MLSPALSTASSSGLAPLVGVQAASDMKKKCTNGACGKRAPTRQRLRLDLEWTPPPPISSSSSAASIAHARKGVAPPNPGNEASAPRTLDKATHPRQADYTPNALITTGPEGANRGQDGHVNDEATGHTEDRHRPQQDKLLLSHSCIILAVSRTQLQPPIGLPMCRVWTTVETPVEFSVEWRVEIPVVSNSWMSSVAGSEWAQRSDYVIIVERRARWALTSPELEPIMGERGLRILNALDLPNGVERCARHVSLDRTALTEVPQPSAHLTATSTPDL
ncbi:hypothetical protein BJ138DRAFT_1118536 [Hygrophoropsis aurantiaca]|uniref:Uncharacterized protein n=1 Tax=Hygrophoropsis aurantiaca TaxID=72124 RepID=A0ACB7ZYE5_9AGAM|nr:hypothetical protein BJ138DRAFT_1118536 [Hygrophoropsis aurantiaca]